MLYIESIDDCNFKLYGNSISKTGVKVLGKQSFTAKAQEPAYNEVQGRLSIYDINKDEKLVNHKPVTDINLNGVVYTTAESFVIAFNLMIAQCSSSSGTLTEVVTKLDSVIACLCRECNDWSLGNVTSTSKVFAAGTLNSITIIVESGTVNVSNGTESTDLIEGQSLTFSAASLLSHALTIDASAGKAIYAVVTCTTTTTTTAAPTTTTTTAVPTTTTTTAA